MALVLILIQTKQKGIYTGCNRRNGPNFGRVFLRSNYTDITQNTYIQSSMVTAILAREKCDFFGVCVLYSLRDVILVISAYFKRESYSGLAEPKTVS